ncbi:MAG: Gfo/Idh/MocA family oxidoreductase [Vulcanimicrobiota bacterium]
MNKDYCGPDPEEPISVLICGAGSRGRTVYGKYISDHPRQARVVAVAEPLESRRHALAQEHGISPELTFGHWQEIAPEQSVAQVAIIATDDRDHLEPALHFLRLGYHVLLEKPMAPSLEDCEKIVEAANQASGLSAVAHVLRYTSYFRKLKSMIEVGLIGKVVTVRHLEPVNYWHFAHSFVRGNWRKTSDNSPFLLAKCCHDMDVLQYLIGEKPVAVQSFGNLSYFKKESAPPRATSRCLDCPLQDECAYSAVKFYGGLLGREHHGWPLDVVVQDFSQQALELALRAGPYGRCVYHCDNDVCDHQVVNFEFESGATASLVATAFTERPARQTEVMGSWGALSGDGSSIVHQDFRNGRTNTLEIQSDGHHLGGDEVMLSEFFQAVRQGDGSLLSTSPENSILSHRMALLAEKSRLEGSILRF